jgi:histidinol-phosphate aminotransferase
MSIKFRKQLAGLRPYQQGKPAEVVEREFGLTRIEKLASNENQFGPSPKAITAMQAELPKLNFYPEGHPFELIETLSAKLGQPQERFAVGNGGEAMIWNLSMIMLGEGDEIVVSVPTFDIYSLSATYLGANTVSVPLKGDAHDIDGMIAAANEKTKLIWLCSPNNPTGNIASIEMIEKLMAGVSPDTVVVLDEAYHEFACGFEDYPKDTIKLLDKYENLVILRTFSKIYGLAGIRVGYIMASPEIIAEVGKVKFTFGVNRLAQVGAKAALTDDEYLADVIAKNKAAIDFLESYYEAKGWDYIKSYANFSWVNIEEDSKLVFEALQREGVIIRPGYHWGWGTWIRISTGTMEQMEFFKKELNKVLENL